MNVHALAVSPLRNLPLPTAKAVINRGDRKLCQVRVHPYRSTSGTHRVSVQTFVTVPLTQVSRAVVV